MGWYNLADNSIKGNNAGTFTGGPAKGVLHTTEGTSASGAIGAFRAYNSWPHFLVDKLGKVWQFVDTDRAARTLKNSAGGVETNRDMAIQIEFVGYASKPTAMSLLQHTALFKLMRWIEVDSGVKPIAPPLPFASRYGQPGTRMKPAVWDAYNGWCGHSHIPENDHWDPGMIDLVSLLPRTPAYEEVKPMYDPPLDMGDVVAYLSRPGGAVVLNKQGAIYAFGAVDKGAPNRHPEYWIYPTQEAVNLHPLGDAGYYVIGKGASTEVGSSGWYAYPE